MNDERGCIDSDFGLTVRYQGETATVNLNVRRPRWWMSGQSVSNLAHFTSHGETTAGRIQVLMVAEAEQGAGEHSTYAYRS